MAYSGDVPGTKFLIEQGADVNKYGGKWHSAIQASTSDDAIGKDPRLFHHRKTLNYRTDYIILLPIIN